jgi:aminocarboxymuconate-semialdehyde decarboxylase
MQTFYLDSALASSPFALPSTTAWAQEDHLTFGTDFPYARPEHIAAFTAALDQFEGVDHAALNRENALGLFPRLA